MNQPTLAQATLTLHWQSQLARHHDALYIQRLNFWRDILPHALTHDQQVGARASTPLSSGENPIPARDASLIRRIQPAQFRRQLRSGASVTPEVGRYYPIGFLQGVDGFYAEDRNPCHCIKVEKESLEFDLNHPLAGRQITAELTIHDLQAATKERGGVCFDWIEEAARQGPGMQARDTPPTAAPADTPLARMDNNPDSLFYAMERLTDHVDGSCRDAISQLLAQRLPANATLLDLMSSQQSHLPGDYTAAHVAGLGMHSGELAANPRLNERIVQDLNLNPHLPWTDNHFDAVTCHLSIEYLTQPRQVIAEVARVLKPGGQFIITFSNRWFPTKAIELWGQLHEFERVGWVLDNLIAQGDFTELETWSLRGQPRSGDDRYASQLANGDPLYAVAGRRR
jgi:SAM-dependent methyltransferase